MSPALSCGVWALLAWTLPAWVAPARTAVALRRSRRTRASREAGCARRPWEPGAGAVYRRGADGSRGLRPRPPALAPTHERQDRERVGRLGARSLRHLARRLRRVAPLPGQLEQLGGLAL